MKRRASFALVVTIACATHFARADDRTPEDDSLRIAEPAFKLQGGVGRGSLEGLGLSELALVANVGGASRSGRFAVLTDFRLERAETEHGISVDHYGIGATVEGALGPVRFGAGPHLGYFVIARATTGQPILRAHPLGAHVEIGFDLVHWGRAAWSGLFLAARGDLEDANGLQPSGTLGLGVRF